MNDDKIIKSNVLIVDQDPSAIKVLTALLEGRGFKVGVVDKGRHAVKMMKGKTADIIITDFSMPDIDGYQLLDHVKAFYRDYKVMVMTDDHDKKESMMDRGLLKAFEKTLSLNEFIDELSVFLDERRKTKRFKVKGKLPCQIIEMVGDVEHPADIVDISVDGALTRSAEDLPPYLKIALDISLSPDSRTVYKVHGHVVRSFTADEDGKFFNAIYFDDERELTIIEQLRPFIRLQNDQDPAAG